MGNSTKTKVAIIGGCGHVGLPLSLVFAQSGFDVVALDLSTEKVNLVNSGIMPFQELGAAEVLSELHALQNKTLKATTDLSDLKNSDILIIVIGTDINKDGNPDTKSLLKLFEDLVPYVENHQTVILRSTVAIGTTRKIKNLLAKNGVNPKVIYCPERIAEGAALRELRSLPQIIGADKILDFKQGEKIFSALGVESLMLSLEEAELAKLFSNAWRYIKFAASNEFWMIAQGFNLEFNTIATAMRYNYPRASDIPSAGFAAGPCLVKDTLQLNYALPNGFNLGRSALSINEGLPMYLYTTLANKYDLSKMTVGILGMSFKSESDDTRSSLSYKLKSIFEFHAKNVLTSDPFVKGDDQLVSLELLIDRADIIIIATPHKIYKDLQTKKVVFDIWGILNA